METKEPEVVKKMNIYEKLNEARRLVRDGGYEKKGRNEYSKYDYFTPEQVEQIVSEVTATTKTICLCNFLLDTLGYYQELILKDLESEESLTFTLRTEKGELKATNATQQMGGTDTYSERYLKMKVFNIKDNNLDMDAKNNTDKTEKTATKKEITKGDNIDPDLGF